MLLKDYNEAIEFHDEVLILVNDAGSKEAVYHNICLFKFKIAVMVAQEDYVNALVPAKELRARASTVGRLSFKKESKCAF